MQIILACSEKVSCSCLFTRRLSASCCRTSNSFLSFNTCKEKVKRSIGDSSLAHLVEEVGLLQPLPLEEGNEVLLELGNELVRLGLLLGDQLHPVHLVQTPELTQQLLHLNEIDKLKKLVKRMVFCNNTAFP